MSSELMPSMDKDAAAATKTEPVIKPPDAVSSPSFIYFYLGGRILTSS